MGDKTYKLDRFQQDIFNGIKVYIVGACILAHIIYEVLFIYYDKYDMAKYNILSITLYCIACLFISRWSFNTYLVIVNIEVTIFATVAVYSLGWGYGFELLFLTLVSSNFFVIYNRIFIRSIVILIEGVLFLGMFSMYRQLWNFESGVQVFYIVNFFVYFFVINVINIKVLQLIYKDNIRKTTILEQENQKISHMVHHDNLTGLQNRLYANKKLMDFVDEYNDNTIDNITVAFADIDDFKKINDTYGHSNGDVVLKKVADILKSHIDSSNVVSRWGGEEFLLCLKNLHKGTAKTIIDDIRKEVENTIFIFDNIDVRITITFGVVSAYKSLVTSEDMVDKADSLLYECKNTGKNRVVYKEI